MKLYLLRHGQTDWNLTWKMQGRTDIPLNQKGLEQAQKAARELKNIPFDLILSSPLIRAKKTAETIAEPHNIKVLPEELLIEMSFGIHEGQTPESDPDKEDRKKLFDFPEEYIPASKGESYEELDKRCKTLLSKLQKDYSSYSNILLVSHGAFFKGLLRSILNADLKDFWKMPLIDNCQILEIEYIDGKWLLPEVYEAFRR